MSGAQFVIMNLRMWQNNLLVTVACYGRFYHPCHIEVVFEFSLRG